MDPLNEVSFPLTFTIYTWLIVTQFYSALLSQKLAGRRKREKLPRRGLNGTLLHTPISYMAHNLMALPQDSRSRRLERWRAAGWIWDLNCGSAGWVGLTVTATTVVDVDRGVWCFLWLEKCRIHCAAVVTWNDHRCPVIVQLFEAFRRWLTRPRLEAPVPWSQLR